MTTTPSPIPEAVPAPRPHSRSCPHPTSDSLANIEFERKPMVDWLAPAQLARTGLKAAIAATFGSYADKRELQAALAEGQDVRVDDEYEFRDGQPLWFDYVADLGDGFNPTYAVARLLADDLTLEFGPKENRQTHETRHGDFVLLGGDQVYPTAARDEYQHRFLGPYRAALPYVEHREAEGKFAPAMYALPGNHDWYDGLTSFLRIFCQRKPSPGGGGDVNGRWVGGWRTRQRRSYFAIKLPQDWWIWAIDSQLESDMDHPQLLYFQTLADAMAPRGDLEAAKRHKIILVTAEPSWVNCPGTDAALTCRNKPEAFNTLAHFEKTYIRARGFQLKLVLSGDLHHYVRYESKERGTAHTVRVTSGGGGAFLFGTEQMPAVISVREGAHETVPAQEPAHLYVKKGAFPDDAESRELSDDVWWMPFRNKSFSALIAVIYVLFAWLLQTGSRGVGVIPGYESLLQFVQREPIMTHFAKYGRAFLFSPLSAALGALILYGMYAFTASQAAGYRRHVKLLGLLHGLAHIVLCCLLMSWTAMALWRFWRLAPGNGWFNFWLIVVLFITGYFFGAWLFSTYLFFVARFTGVHAGELFSSMNIEGYKNILRLRLSPDGTLRVYAIGLRRVPKDWKFRAPGPDGHGEPWFHSEKFNRAPGYKPHLIESFEVK